MKNLFTWEEALAESDMLLDEMFVLEDEDGDFWECVDDLQEYYVEDPYIEDGSSHKFCVDPDGSIGITKDNGNSIEWIYKARCSFDVEEPDTIKMTFKNGFYVLAIAEHLPKHYSFYLGHRSCDDLLFMFENEEKSRTDIYKDTFYNLSDFCEEYEETFLTE